MPHSYEFQIKWYQRLSIRALMFFVLLAISVIGVTTITMNIVSQEITEHLAYEKLSHSQQEVLTGLSERTKIAATLANTMAFIAINTYEETNLFKKNHYQRHQ